MDETLFARAHATMATTREIVQSCQWALDQSAEIAAQRRALRAELRETLEARGVRLDLITLTIDLQIALDKLNRCTGAFTA